MAYRTINPATGKVVKTYDDISDAALSEAMDVAEACYENDWSLRSIAQRAEVIHAAAELMRRNRDRLASLSTLEMGKLIAEAKSEVTLSADIFDYYARMAKTFLKPRPIPDVPNATIETFSLGIILGVEP
jgi:succinate-semialdehyde dehydrogenase/glutarate-semialdehyde dehydrogenase